MSRAGFYKLGLPNHIADERYNTASQVRYALSNNGYSGQKLHDALTLASFESGGFDKDARNSKTVSGVFQFTDGTYAETIILAANNPETEHYASSMLKGSVLSLGDVKGMTAASDNDISKVVNATHHTKNTIENQTFAFLINSEITGNKGISRSGLDSNSENGNIYKYTMHQLGSGAGPAVLKAYAQGNGDLSLSQVKFGKNNSQNAGAASSSNAGLMMTNGRVATVNEYLSNVERHLNNHKKLSSSLLDDNISGFNSHNIVNKINKIKGTATDSANNIKDVVTNEKGLAATTVIGLAGAGVAAVSDEDSTWRNVGIIGIVIGVLGALMKMFINNQSTDDTKNIDNTTPNTIITKSTISNEQNTTTTTGLTDDIKKEATEAVKNPNRADSELENLNQGITNNNKQPISRGGIKYETYKL